MFVFLLVTNGIDDPPFDRQGQSNEAHYARSASPKQGYQLLLSLGLDVAVVPGRGNTSFQAVVECCHQLSLVCACWCWHRRANELFLGSS